MRFFFRSKKFKIYVSIFSVVLVFIIVLNIIGRNIGVGTGTLGAFTAPFQKMFSDIKTSVSEYHTKLYNSEVLIEENEKLKTENEQLKESLNEYEEAIKENEFYEQFLEIKKQNPEIMLQPAKIISRDNADVYSSFIIDSGSLDGVAVNDPVITSAGVVGIVIEAAPTYSKVVSILDSKFSAGAIDSRTADAGVVSGKAELAQNGQTAMNNLLRSCSVTVGDYIITSGGSTFPSGLMLGTVVDIKKQEKDTSLYAIVEPVDDVGHIKEVMVITYFTGQGVILPSEEQK